MNQSHQTGRSVAEGVIPVVASSDQNYAMHLTVMFTSLLRNCSDPERVQLFCIDGGIPEQTRERMNEEIVHAGGRGIEFINVDKKRFEHLPTLKHITSSAYYRIAIPELFDESVKKVVYLDCDIIVRGDILELAATDLTGFGVAAVENISGHTYKKLGIPQSEYFNSGVLLLNLDYWRENGISDQVLRFKQENPHRISTNDQCALNGILHESWKHLPLKWNHQTGLYRQSDQTDAFSPEEVKSANLNPKVIHYIGWDKPWRKVRFHPLADEYDRYADQLLGPSPRPKPGVADYIRAYGSVSHLKKWWRCRKNRRWYRSNGFDLYGG
ncbi:general stress glycosyltransferase GspA [Marinobacter santoriniensis NKSG1]|uniref:General stress glycosyltransferase GspA n=1 Tax=Marinobacter santoriniensis NKSG1 TaxID=1288826 RepID=M7CPN5_9GAMM|nr:glycosyltransferase family 8 protein [Marinobacter santoriniensis]EMP54010.1 general stress glycosyltransferase GspA [Marinobacter santoriniensis NKSG1]